MTKILMLHGIHHDQMGKGSNSPHGATTMECLNQQLAEEAARLSVEVVPFQSNDPEQVVQRVLAAPGEGIQGILFNPATWTEDGEVIAAALAQSGLPVLELHMSNIQKEPVTRNVIAPAVTGLLTGFGEAVYVQGLRILAQQLENR